MQETICKNCKYFIQHYAVDDDRFVRIYCGHCTFQKVRSKRPDAAACKYFSPGSDATQAFVSKQYLSKALLNYVLSLDLLPEMKAALESGDTRQQDNA